jgi:hypothetical protein
MPQPTDPNYKAPGSYPISRALNFPIGYFTARGAQGRVNQGKASKSKAEEIYFSGIAKEDPNGLFGHTKTYPVSRAITSPEFRGVLGAGVGASLGYMKGPGVAAAAGIAGGAGSYFISKMRRDLAARAAIGQANTGKEGITKVRSKQLKELKAKGPLDTNREDRSQMNQELGTSVGAGLVGKMVHNKLL